MLHGTVKGHLSNVAPCTTTATQFKCWLIGEEKLVGLRCPRQRGKSVGDKAWWKEVYKALSDSTIGAQNFDFLWRVCRGALKTGEFVSRYNIPGTRTKCVFCLDKLETVEHLFSECSCLSKVRQTIVGGVEQLGLTINPKDYLPLLCIGIGYQTGARVTRSSIMNLVGECNRRIWVVRNSALFGNSQIDTRKLECIIEAIVTRRVRSTLSV